MTSCIGNSGQRSGAWVRPTTSVFVLFPLYFFIYLFKKFPVKTNGMILTEELREELNQAAFATTQAFAVARSTPQGEDVSNLVLNQGSALEDMLAEKLERQRDREDQNGLSGKILVMQPVLRFLQLLCENHNRDLQVKTLGGKGHCVRILP